MTRDNVTYPQTVRIIALTENGEATIRYRNGDIKQVGIMPANEIGMAVGQMWAIYDINPANDRLISYQKVS